MELIHMIAKLTISNLIISWLINNQVYTILALPIKILCKSIVQYFFSHFKLLAIFSKCTKYWSTSFSWKGGTRRIWFATSNAWLDLEVLSLWLSSNCCCNLNFSNWNCCFISSACWCICNINFALCNANFLSLTLSLFPQPVTQATLVLNQNLQHCQFLWHLLALGKFPHLHTFDEYWDNFILSLTSFYRDT